MNITRKKCRKEGRGNMSIQAINEQLRLFEEQFEELDQPTHKKSIKLLDLDQYDKILVQSSGG